MNKFNKDQEKIIREEFARTIMIQKAKNTLNEEEFQTFVNELTDYEQNLVLTESNRGEFLYENLFQRLKNVVKGKLKKMAPDDQEKLESLAGDIEMAYGAAEGWSKDKYAATAAAKRAEMQRLLVQMAEISPEAAKSTAQAYGVPFGDSASSSDNGGGDKSGGDKAPPPTGDVKDDAKAVGGTLESPKAKGIFASIYDSYKYAFATNAAAWKRIYDIMNGVGTLPVGQQAAAVAQVQDKVEKDLPKKDEPDTETPEETDPAVQITKGRNGMQSRISRLFPDLAKNKGTFYYRDDTGKIVSKNTSVLNAIIKDVIAQLKGSGIEVNESRVKTLTEIFLMMNHDKLLTEATLNSFKGKLRQTLQQVRDSEEDPRKRKKKIDKFLYRLRHYAKEGNMAKFASRYDDIKSAKNLSSQFDTLSSEEQTAGMEYASKYAQKQFTGDETSVRGKAADGAPKSKSKEQMSKMVPKIKSGVLNISQIIGPKLKAAGYDLKSKEGGDLQKRLLKVLRRFLGKELQRIGKDQEVRILGKFSRSKPDAKAAPEAAPETAPSEITESLDNIRERYISFYSQQMLEGIVHELSSN